MIISIFLFFNYITIINIYFLYQIEKKTIEFSTIVNL